MANESLFTSNTPTKGKAKHQKRNYILIPIIIAMAIIPLIVHQYTFDNNLSTYSWFIADDSTNDFFQGYKSILLIINGFVMVGIFIYQLLSKKLHVQLKLWKLLIGIYAIFVILSTICSKHQSAALNGSYEHFETMWVLLSYCLLVFYCFEFVKNEKDISLIVKALLISSIIIGLIGSLQAFGWDFFRTYVGKLLISNSSEWSRLDEFIFSFEKGRVYSTLFNPNYVGVYASLVVPITIGIAILTKDVKQRILALVTSFVLVLATFGSQSRTSLITLAVTTILLVILLRRRIIHNWKPLAIAVGSMVTLFIVANILNNNAYLNRITSLFSSTEQAVSVEKVETSANNLKIGYKGETLLIQCFMDENETIACQVANEQGDIYETYFDESNMRFIINHEVLYDIYITPIYLDEQYTFGFKVTMNNVDWVFKSPTSENGYQFLNQFGRFTDAITADASLFTNNGLLFSGRGYIWSRTLPLLKSSLIIGTGPETFVYYFPQEDYAGKMNNGFQSQAITKPHNMYLQMFIQTGGVSCLVFLLLYIIYMIQCLRTYAKSNFTSYTEKIGVVIFVGTVGYMISGLINDSTVTVAPVFWGLLGIGFACNRIVCEQKEKSSVS